MIKAKGCRSQREELRGPSAGSLGDGRQRRKDPREEGLRLLPSSQRVSRPPPQNREFPKEKLQARMGTENSAQRRQSAAVQVLYHRTREQALRYPVRRDTQLEC